MNKQTRINLNKVGSFYNFPNWRYQVYLNPSKAGLAWCCRKPKSGDSSLKRYLQYPDVRETLEVNFSFPPRFQKVVGSLSEKNRTLFYKLFNKKLKDENTKKLFCSTFSKNHEVWSIDRINALNDGFLKKLLYHASNFSYDPYIQFAVGLKHSKEHEHIFRAIGYHIYAGLTDNEISKRFKLYPKQLEAIRLTFFDFAHSPKEPTARAAYFTQLVDNEIITDLDRRFYKLIAELGEIGLKAHSNYHSLTPEEKVIVEDYLGNTMLDNVLSLNFAVTDMKDALNFNSVINNLASFYIKKEEVNYYRAKVRNLDASTQRIASENNAELLNVDPEDEEALKLIGKLALTENSLPTYPAITELK
jgi:hypothetical protein